MGKHRSRRHIRRKRKEAILELPTNDPLEHIWPAVRKDTMNSNHSEVRVKVPAHEHDFDGAGACAFEGCQVTRAAFEAAKGRTGGQTSHLNEQSKGKVCPNCNQSGIDGRKRECPECGERMPHWIGKRTGRKPKPIAETDRPFKVDDKPSGDEVAAAVEASKSEPDEAAPTTETPGGAQLPPDSSGPAAALPESDFPRPKGNRHFPEHDHGEWDEDGYCTVAKECTFNTRAGAYIGPDGKPIGQAQEEPDRQEALVALAGKMVRDGIRHGFAVEIEDEILAKSTIEFDPTNRVVRIALSKDGE